MDHAQRSQCPSVLGPGLQASSVSLPRVIPRASLCLASLRGRENRLREAKELLLSLLHILAESAYPVIIMFFRLTNVALALDGWMLEDPDSAVAGLA